MRQDSFDLTMVQLLMSHLCHELVSPVGAINNGIELIGETSGCNVEPGVLSLIGEGARQAADRLRLYRLAYGRGGIAQGFGMKEARQALYDHLAHDPKMTLDWPLSMGHEFSPGGMQIILNLGILASACMPRGGRLTIMITAHSASASQGAGLPAPGGDEPSMNEAVIPVSLLAQGQGVALNDLVRRALEGRREAVDHGSIHACFCWHLLKRLNCPLHIGTSPGGLVFTLVLPQGTPSS